MSPQSPQKKRLQIDAVIEVFISFRAKSLSVLGIKYCVVLNRSLYVGAIMGIARAAPC
jgi:hypothetical protein